MPVRALFFDLDDTLLETHEAHAAAIRVSCLRAAEHHPDWSPEAFHEAFVRAYRVLEAEMEAGNLNFSSQRMFRTRTWEETLKACNLTHDVATELADVYLAERRRRFRLYPDVEAALNQLPPHYKLVMVTNGLGDLQREKIAAVRLERWFPHIVVSGEVGSWKPHGDIFRKALALAEVEPHEAVMIGDSLERDIAGGRALGLHTIWMRRYEHLHPIPGIEPHAIASDLTTLAEVLARICPDA